MGSLQFLRRIWRILKSPRTPGIVKALIVLTAVYVLNPFDVIPDFLLPFGILDDAGAVMVLGQVGSWLLNRYAPEEQDLEPGASDPDAA